MITVSQIVKSFDGKNFWPYKVIKFTDKTATVVQVNLDGTPCGNPTTRKIHHNTGRPAVNVHACEIVYLTEEYKNELFMASSDI